jgi:hypothetical protein
MPQIVINTLQFLLSDQVIRFEKFELQDRVLVRLRRMANQHQVHLCVVIIPERPMKDKILSCTQFLERVNQFSRPTMCR